MSDAIVHNRSAPNHCTLLFSGGRDSSIAAVKLGRTFGALDLVTITSDHLVGVEAVRARLAELKRHLPKRARWFLVRQPTVVVEPPGSPSGLSPLTCLPCQLAYLVAALHFAVQAGAKCVAAGYAQYQADWPEQSPEAVRRISNLLEERGVAFLVPAYDFKKKSEAERFLTEAGLSPTSLEQKCLKQVFNKALPPDELTSQLQIWEDMLRRSLAAAAPPMEIIEQRDL